MILVTGATGNVGRELVRLLLDKGERVRVLGREEGRLADLGGRMERVLGDLDKPETLTPAMQGVERLYLVTAQKQQVINLVEAAARAGVQYMVKQSTIEAGRSLGPGMWHREQEKLIESSGLSWTFLRPTMMMVNTIEWWASTIRSQGSVYFPGGKGRVSPVDPMDIAAVACTVLTQAGHEGKVYELTGPEVLTIRDMVRILSRVLGRPIRYVNVPVFMAAIWMRRSGLSKQLVNGLMETLGALRRNEYAYVTDLVARVGECEPRSFEEWCRDHITAFQ